jgi:hypothetical protein
MNKVRAIIIGSLIWILGASFYTASYFLPFLDNKELQADLVLAIAIIPNAWLGAKIYYRKGNRTHGFNVGFIVLLTAILLDGLITVPFFIIPNGGSYKNFFGAPSFWLIALEYFLVVYSYWRIKIKSLLIQTS